jgi:hypothetical protein
MPYISSQVRTGAGPHLPEIWDLDRVAQMFTLALGFLSVAAVAAGVDAIAGAVK